MSAVVAALSQADFLPAVVTGYSWAVSPQPRNAPLAGRPAGREGGTLTHSLRRLMGPVPSLSLPGSQEQHQDQGDDGLSDYG